jgi:hypothetical protein
VASVGAHAALGARSMNKGRIAFPFSVRKDAGDYHLAFRASVANEAPQH